METSPLARVSILEQLERMLAAETFSGAVRSKALLRFLVEQTVANQADRLKEYTLGSEALGRGDSFDPRTDPIVRAEASRLRSRMERYYAAEGAADPVLITLPKGSYVPQFQIREIAQLAAVPQRQPAIGRLQRLLWFALGGLAVGSLALAVWAWNRADAARVLPGAQEFDVDLTQPDRILGSEFGNDVVLSPDGTRIVWVARGSDGRLRLLTVRLGQRDIAELPDTEGARAPFFSADGRWVGFWSDARLKKVSVEGGSPVTFTDAVDFGGASWYDQDRMVAALNSTLVRVPSSPGKPEVLLDLGKERINPRWPQVLPGGTHVLFTALSIGPRPAFNVEVLSLVDGTRTTLVPGGAFGRYLRDGYLLYVNQDTLYAVPFDMKRLALRGTSVPVLEGIASSSVFGYAQLDLSQDGTLLYRRGPASRRHVVSWVDRSGNITPLLASPGAYLFPRLSPDSQQLALNIDEGGARNSILHDRQRDHTQRLPLAPGHLSPVWSPDGSYLVIGGLNGMSWINARDGSKSGALTRNVAVQVPWSFTPDGTRLAYHEMGPSSAFDIWTVEIRMVGGTPTAGKPELFLRTPSYDTYPSFSPDGRWLAYASGQYGPFHEVYVQPFPPDRTKEVQISEGGGRISRWLPGGELVYRTDDHRLMVVSYEVKNGTIVPVTRREWSELRLADTSVLANFDVEPGGKRILALLSSERAVDEKRRNQVTVILNFPEWVRQRLSTGGQASR